MGRAPCCDKANVKKGPWSPEEDAKLKSYIEQHGTGGNWIALPRKIGLKRCGKSCRLRWLNYLRPNIKHGGFSEEEDNIICSLYISIGSRWSIIAAHLPGRTDNDIKNYWNTRLKKKLLGKQHRKQKQAKPTKMTDSTSSDNISDSLIYQYHPWVTYDLRQLPSVPPLPMIPNYSSNQSEPAFTDHASIRKLLIKLGGRFSNGDTDLIKNINHDQSQLVRPVYHPSMDFMSNVNTAYGTPSISGTHFDMSGHLHGTSVDLCENQEKLQGLEFLLYGDAVNTNMDWGEMSSVVFAASSSSNNEGFLQGSAMQEFGFNNH